MKFIKQHLIDPQACIRCNACLESCPSQAIAFDGANYIVDFEACDFSQTCMRGCPTGAIAHARMVPEGQAYTLADQSSWSSLPIMELAAPPPPDFETARAPWSAAKPWRTPYTSDAPALARVTANQRVTDAGADNDIHHLVLDFSPAELRFLEGQTLGILPPGMAANGRPHHMRAYSIASARDGETPGSKDVAITVKRDIGEWDGQPYRGIASNYLCDLQVGDIVPCVGPLGHSFLLPEHPGTRLLMICTGTGIAPMRGFIERHRRRNKLTGAMLLYGGRTPGDMAYLSDLRALPTESVSLHLALSRQAGHPKQYVQDLLWAQRELLGEWLCDENTFVYVCGLKGMETGVIETLRAICDELGKDWEAVHDDLRIKARLHIETY